MKDLGTIAIYSRKSVSMDTKKQLELCMQYIHTRYKGYRCEQQAEADGQNTNDILIYEDDVFPAALSPLPQFTKMMEDANEQKFSTLICHSLDRVCQNAVGFSTFISELDKLGISLIVITEQLDTSSSLGRAMVYISSIFSRLEQGSIVESKSNAVYELAKTGLWGGKLAPVGYEIEDVKSTAFPSGSKRTCKLRLIPEEAETVKAVFKTFLQSKSLSETENLLTQQAYLAKKRRPITIRGIRDILSDPVYMIADKDAFEYFTLHNVDLVRTDFDNVAGVIAYNYITRKTNRPNVLHPIEQWVVSVGEHQGLISGADWVLAQEYLKRNSNKSYNKPDSEDVLLSGLLHCTCGSYLMLKPSDAKDSNNKLIYYYVCAAREKSRARRCSMSSIHGNMIDDAIYEEVKKLSVENSEFLQQLEINKEQSKANQEEYSDTLGKLKIEQDTLEKDIANLISTMARMAGSLAEEYIINQVDDMHKKNIALKERIAEIEALMEAHELSEIEFDVIRQVLFNFTSTFGSMNLASKRETLRSFVKHIVWDGENIHMHLFGIDTPIVANMHAVKAH